MTHDNKNFILAIVLSIAIIFGWQFFYARRLREAGRAAPQTTQSQTQTQTGGTTQPQPRSFPGRSRSNQARCRAKPRSPA